MNTGPVRPGQTSAVSSTATASASSQAQDPNGNSTATAMPSIALKIIKNKPAYFHQALVEVRILRLLNSVYDPKDSQHLVESGLPLPAYEQVMKASHAFNLLDARHAISVTERQRYILRVRTLSKAVAEVYYAKREALGFPLCKNLDNK